MLAIANIHKTMSSREIADLTDKDIAHVHRDIRSMLEQLKDDPELDHVLEDRDARGYTTCFHLTKNLSLTLVAGYNVKLRKAIIDRWQKLEAQQAPKLPAIPQTFAQALMLAAQQAQEIEVQQALIEQQKPAVEFLDRYVEAKSSKGIREVAKVLGIPERQFIARLEEDGILFRQGSNLLPYAQHQHAGYFEVKTGEASGHAYHQTRFTPAGVAWIARRMTLQSGRTAHVARAQPASNDARAQNPI